MSQRKDVRKNVNRRSSSGASSNKTPVRRARQGSVLPVDGSRLSEYPEGCCVLISPSAQDVRMVAAKPPLSAVESPSSPAWHLVSFRIGRDGSPHCRMLRNPPSSLEWNVGMGLAAETNGYLLVLGSRWPERAAPLDDALGTEADPIQVMQSVKEVNDANSASDANADGDFDARRSMLARSSRSDRVR
jgi:hypothetical protein